MSKAKLFSEQNKAEAGITLFLSGGREISGKIKSIAEDYVVIQDGSNQLTIFFEMIGGWAPAMNKQLETPEDGTDNSSDINTKPNVLDVAIFEILRSKPTIALPRADFNIENLVPDDSQELVRAKNKYEYAIKIKELSRLHTIIPPLIRLAERTCNPTLFCLCGVLNLELGAIPEAEELFNKSLIQPISHAFVAYAYIESTRDNWRKCATNLLTAIYLSVERKLPFQDLLESLGKTLGQCQDREVLGLIQILEWVQDEQQHLARLICAFAIHDRYPDAASLVMEGKIKEAHELAPNSSIFLSFDPPKAAKPVEPPPVSRDPVIGTSSQFGYVSAFYLRGHKGFGFIRDETRGETFYFDTDHVIDQGLLNEIRMDKAGQKIDFIPSKAITPNTRYRMALEVKRSGSEFTVKPLEARKTITTLSKTAPAYERARAAESKNNLEEAAKFYNDEIRNKGPYWKSAVMDLSTLLHRQGNTQEAINLLDQYSSKLDRREAIQNQKITFLMAAKQYAKTTDIIKAALSQAKDNNKTQTLLRQLAYCQYKSGHHDEAIATLNKLPKDDSTHQMMQMVEQARATSDVTSEGDIAQIGRELSQWTSGISPFAQYLLDSFDDSYIDERSKARGYYDGKDFAALDNFFERIPGKRPGEKGKVSITLAALCEKSPEGAGDRLTNDYLRRALTFMGEAAFSDAAHSDIARCYLTEAATMCSAHEVDKQLALIIASYLTDKPAPSNIAARDGRFYVKDLLSKLVQDKAGHQRFEKDFIYYSAMSSALTINLERAAPMTTSVLNKILTNKIQLQKLRDGEMERLRRERNILMTLAGYDYTAASSYIDATNQLRDQAFITRFETDRIRLNLLSNIAKDGAAYINEPDYVERERKFLRVSQEIVRFSEEIRREPTKITIEFLLPILEQMEKKLKDNFDAFVAKSAVQLTLSNVLENDYYIPEYDRKVRVCISVKSAHGGAPIEGLEISADEIQGLRVIESGLSPELFRGGEEREIELTIEPSPEQIADAAFTLQCIVRYRKRNGELVEHGKQSLPVRIGSPRDFTPIPNPYRDYAGGRSVDNPDMFIGRQALLSRILDVVNKDSMGQCFSLYGQKRSGKTSVLKQLKKRLIRPFLAAEISIGSLETTADDPSNSFFQLCLDRIQEAAEDSAGLTNIAWWPQPQDLQKTPLESFRKTIKYLKKELEALGWRSPRIVLLIDEFTYLYEYIAEGVLPSTFMRQWKSLLQMEMFNAVIVGQDSMSKFKQAFPNEFGVTFDERITYLSRDEAIQLAQEPILLNGQSRYRGRAIERLLQLTGGSPFYMQIFCDRLVFHMNQKQASFITEADIEMVATLLTTGAEALPIERFDPLITAAGESVAEAAREKYLILLSSIAKNSDAITGARPTDLQPTEKKELMLKDMHERDVIISDAEGRVKIRVELFQEWLKIHSDFMEIGGRS